MFTIPQNHTMELTLEQATGIIAVGGSVITGMEHVREHWYRYVDGLAQDMYEDDDAFFDAWAYEVNAYNVVYTNMKELA